MVPVINLKAERLNRGQSLRQASKAMGISEGTLRRAEDHQRINPSNAFAIASYYGYQVTGIWPVEHRVHQS